MIDNKRKLAGLIRPARLPGNCIRAVPLQVLKREMTDKAPKR